MDHHRRPGPTGSECFFTNLKMDEAFPQSPIVTRPSDSSPFSFFRQTLAGCVSIPGDLRTRKLFLVKGHEYAQHKNDSSIATGVLVSCMSIYKGWDGHLFNYLTVDKDQKAEALTLDHTEGLENVEPTEISEVIAHTLLLAMARHFLDDDDARATFIRVLDEKSRHSELVAYMRDRIDCPFTWMRHVKGQMDLLPKLKARITRFLMATVDRRAKDVLNELRSAEMLTFKACIHFIYQAPKTMAHVQPYIVREMLILRKFVTKIRTLPKEEREFAALLHPGEYLPPVHVYSNLAFCAVYQYGRAERWEALIDCPYKQELKTLVRRKLQGPLKLAEFAEKERSMLKEVDIDEDYQEESGPLLAEYEAPTLEEFLKSLVAEIRVQPMDPVASIQGITF